MQILHSAVTGFDLKHAYRKSKILCSHNNIINGYNNVTFVTVGLAILINNTFFKFLPWGCEDIPTAPLQKAKFPSPMSVLGIKLSCT